MKLIIKILLFFFVVNLCFGQGTKKINTFSVTKNDSGKVLSNNGKKAIWAIQSSIIPTLFVKKDTIPVLLNRANHTGVQAISTVAGLQPALDAKQASLGYTPYNATNPSGYISSYTETDPILRAINGLVKSNGMTISAATAGTDYALPNSTNTNYANDYRAANFVAGTNYLAPNGSAAALTGFPTLNQNTTGTASNITATSNSTLTTLSNLSLPYSQLSGMATLILKKYASAQSTPSSGLKLYASSANNNLVTVDSTGAVKNVPYLEAGNNLFTGGLQANSMTGVVYVQSPNRMYTPTINAYSSTLAFGSVSHTEWARFHSNGNLSLNSTTNAGYLLDVNGTSRFTGNMTVTGNIIPSGGSSTVGTTGAAFYSVYSSQFFGDYILPRSSFGISFQNTSGIDILKMFNSTKNVAIGTTTDVVSAVFQVASISQGSIPFPKMTTSQRDTNITSPVEGLFIYNTTDHVPQFWNGTVWKTITTN